MHPVAGVCYLLASVPSNLMPPTMTYNTLLTAHHSLADLDTEAMDVPGKVTLYRLTQYVENELQTYQQALKDIAGGTEAMDDLTEQQKDDVRELLATPVDTDPPHQVAQASLPDSITIEQIAALDAAGMLDLD